MPSTLNLRLGNEIFPVKKAVLFKKLGLFQMNPSLLGAEDYEVKATVPGSDFEKFVRIVEGGPLFVSESTLDSFCCLSQEFDFELLSAACTAFLASKDCWGPPRTAVASETAAVRPRVTIRKGNYSATYESLKSYKEIVYFGIDLGQADQGGIVIEGMNETNCVIEKAVEVVYGNTVSDLGLSETTKPFLALVLWVLHDWLSGESIDAMIYCLNRLNEIAPTTFDKARLLFLSQADNLCSDDFGMDATESWGIVHDAIGLLQTERNGRRKEAKELLRKLKNTGRFESSLGEPDWARKFSPTAWSTRTLASAECPAGKDPSTIGTDGSLRASSQMKTGSEAESGGVRINPVTGTPDKPSWLRRLFMSWFRPRSADMKHAPVQFSRAVCDQPQIKYPVVDISWFK
jgi:hypothetical protein